MLHPFGRYYINKTFSQFLFLLRIYIINGARRVYIIGSLGLFLFNCRLSGINFLNNLQDNVILLRQGDFSAFADVTSEDSLIAIGFARYTRITCETAKIFL